MSRSSGGGRNRWPLVLLVVVSLVAGVAAVSGASTGGTGVRFAAVGRWFADPGQGNVFHVNGVSRTVDARAAVGRVEPGTEVVEGEHSSYVIDSEQIRELDRSSLRVTGTSRPPARERPATVEAGGQPYAVYRQAGRVVRLGPDETVIEAGGPLGAPVATPDGTLWLHRLAAGLLCYLPPGADRVTCPISVPPGATGALSTLDGVAIFLDSADDTVTTLTADGPGRVTSLGADLPAGLRVAPASVQGRVAVLAGGDLLLLDARGIAGGVPLPAGRWAAPMAGRSSVVLLELKRRQIHTYSPTGRPQRVTPLPPGSGDAQLRQGQDGRVYVQAGQGRHVFVVDDQGGAETATPGAGAARPAGVRPPGATTDVPDTGPPVSASPSFPVPAPTVTTNPRLATGSSTLPTSAAGSPTTTGSPEVIAPPEATGPPDSSPPGSSPSGGGPPDASGPPGTAGPPETPVLPPSRPGMPPGLTAVARGLEMILTWDAAPDNGSGITAYEVTWTAADGATGTTTTGGQARSVAIGGLDREKPYRFGVHARNAGGVGVPAMVEAALPSRWITVRRGADTTYEDKCGPPECAFPYIELFGFPPRTEIQITPLASAWGQFNPGAKLTTNDQGYVSSRTRFPFSGVGQTLWVDVGDTQSNRFLWPEKGPS